MAGGGVPVAPADRLARRELADDLGPPRHGSRVPADVQRAASPSEDVDLAGRFGIVLDDEGTDRLPHGYSTSRTVLRTGPAAGPGAGPGCPNARLGPELTRP